MTPEEIINTRCDHVPVQDGTEFVVCYGCLIERIKQDRSEGVDEGLEKGAKVAEGDRSWSDDLSTDPIAASRYSTRMNIAKEIRALKGEGE